MHSITVVEPDLQFPATGNRVGRLQRLLSVDAGKVACWDCYGTGHNKVEKERGGAADIIDHCQVKGPCVGTCVGSEARKDR